LLACWLTQKKRKVILMKKKWKMKNEQSVKYFRDIVFFCQLRRRFPPFHVVEDENFTLEYYVFLYEEGGMNT
jgi:hypothetical protein